MRLKITALFLTLCGAIPTLVHHPHDADHDRFHYFAIQLADDDTVMLHGERHQPRLHELAHKVAKYHQFDVVGQIGTIFGHYLIRMNAAIGSGHAVAQQLMQHDNVRWAELQLPEVRHAKRMHLPVRQEYDIAASLGIQDPLFHQQWHLINAKQSLNDINVTGVWQMGVTGKGVTTAVIDDGVDYEHEDIKDNFHVNGSYDFNQKSQWPKPLLADDYHGTRCAGEIAAVKNGVCGVGIAYEAKVAGIRILGGPITSTDEALALNYGMQVNDIYSCSWGPQDDARRVEGPNQLVTNAILNGIQNGRGGRGSVFVFATGNGGNMEDNCNYDGYTNSIYTISIGAIDRRNRHPMYSEKCSAQLASTYSSGAGSYIVTTDIHDNSCTSEHGGTSAAAPLMVGILALALQVRPELTWRDLQYLTIESAVPVSTHDKDWQRTHSGRLFSHSYGYGSVDTYKIVTLAKTWQLVNIQTKLVTDRNATVVPITFGKQGVTSTITVVSSAMKDARMLRTEHVTVNINLNFTKRGQLDIYLISPHGIVSHIGPSRENDVSPDGFQDWTFMSVKHWQEDPVGVWQLKIINANGQAETGQLNHWWLTVYGESMAPLPKRSPPVIIPVFVPVPDADVVQKANSVHDAGVVPPLGRDRIIFIAIMALLLVSLPLAVWLAVRCTNSYKAVKPNDNYYVEAVELSAMGNDFLLTDSEDSGDEGFDDSSNDDANSVDNFLFQHIQAQKAVLGSRNIKTPVSGNASFDYSFDRTTLYTIGEQSDEERIEQDVEDLAD